MTLMKPDPISQAAVLRKRELELRKIILQMKDDKLNSSTVFRNLQNELHAVKVKLSDVKH